MSDTDHLDHEQPEHEELPRRPRRRLLAPVPVTLLAVLLTACGFIGGVLVEKGQQSAAGQGGRNVGTVSASRGVRVGAGTTAPTGPSGAGGSGNSSTATVGEVANINRGRLYVTDTQGNTVKVTIPAGLKVSKTVSTSAHQIHPGEPVVVQGSRNSDGSVTARSIGIGAAGGRLGGLLGGARPGSSTGTPPVLFGG